MRFDLVIAHAFGPFSGRSLEFTPGMNVIFGPNESGKSTWHAALYLGLCGIRRGKGKMKKDSAEQLFQEKHKPWDGEEWKVCVVIRLEDGRRVELQQDLLNSAKCRARDADLGRDYTQDIVSERSPDGALWLGLDRHSFLATAFVRQADLLEILEYADTLQEYLQRAAATSGRDSTVASALRSIEKFKSENVGLDKQHSTKPLRMGKIRIENARQSVEKARSKHSAYLELCEQWETLKRNEDEIRRRLRLAEARRARSESDNFNRRSKRARELAALHPEGPSSGLAEEDRIARSVSAALQAWESCPPIPDLSGKSSGEVRSELESLPPPPAGDLEPAQAVVEAHRQFLKTRLDLEAHRRNLPAGFDGDPGLEERRSRLEENLSESIRRLRKRNLVWIALGALFAVSGVVLVAFDRPVAGLVVLVVGASLAVWALIRRNPGFLVGIEAEMKELDGQIVTSDVLAGEVRRRLEGWEMKERELTEQAERASSGLKELLENHGTKAERDLEWVFSEYQVACQERARLAAAVSRRGYLESQLSERLKLEETAARIHNQREKAKEALHTAAARCGIDSLDEVEVVNGLRDWEKKRHDAIKRHEQSIKEWEELQAILDGRSLDELIAEAEKRRQSAEILAAEFTEEELASACLEDPGSEVDRIRKEMEKTPRTASNLHELIRDREKDLPSVSEAKEELKAAEEELERILRLEEILDITRDFLARAQERVHRDIAPILADSVRRRLPEVTRGRYQDVIIDARDLKVQVRGEGGHWREAALLSHGTAEQIYLLLRVAMAERLTQPKEVCPLILDDIAVQSSAERKEAILCVLKVLSRKHQVILFTQEIEVLEWAQRNLEEPQDRVILLDPSKVPA